MSTEAPAMKIVTANSSRIEYPRTYLTATVPICAPSAAPASIHRAAVSSTRPLML